LSNPTDVLASIPGWEDARWRRLAGGTNRPVFHVTNGKKDAVLKIGEHARGGPFNTPEQEATVQTVAAGNGLAADVLYAAPGAYLTEFVHGDAWEQRHFKEIEYLEMLAVTLRQVHALPVTGLVFDARSAARLYAAQADDADREWTGFCLDVVEKSRLPQKLCCCHNDVVAENLLLSPGLTLIDWEYACDNDPFFDLATVIEHHDLSDQQVSVLVNAYCGKDGKDDSNWRERLAEQRQLYLALWWLWMSPREKDESDSGWRLAERLFTSCS